MIPDVRLIAAVGRSGQIGLKGGLPWGDLFPEDRIAFREATRDCPVIVGHNTWPSVKHLHGTHGRDFFKDNTGLRPQGFLRLYGLEDRTVWIAGGAKTYLRWLPFAGERRITVLEWDGPADVWMPRDVWSPEVPL
jgi:dihydromethanopterin reductase